MTRLDMIRFEDYFDPNKVITNSNPIVKNEFSKDGIFSEDIFGKENDPDNIDSIAWIDFGENYVISPLMYSRIEKLIKASVLDAIIQFDKRIDANGNFMDTEPEEGRKIVNIADRNVGLIDFRIRFIELLRKYTPQDRKEFPEYKNLIKWYFEGKVFTSKFPVFSPKLRPAQIFPDEKTFQFSEINNYYNFLLTHSNIVKGIEGDDSFEDVKLQKLKMMYKLQQDVNRIGDSIIDFIKGKSGTIRKNILAGRVNFSARNVIVPGPTLRTNEIILNYTTFLQLYKIPLVNLISISEGITYIESLNFVENGSIKFDKKLHRYMMELVTKTKGGLRAILNRNPSISIHSIQIVVIVDIGTDIEDYTMSISNNILSGLGADFDGDVLNLIALFSEDQYREFSALDPINQIISNNDGKFNRTFSVDKDSRLAIYLMNNPNCEDVELEIVD